MNTFVALLRAINVGGTGKLPMAELRQLCEACGFSNVATYIQSGNVVFRSVLGEAAAKKTLEQALAVKMGKPFGVMMRGGAEMARLTAEAPYPAALPNQLYVIFLDAPPDQLAKDRLANLVAPGGEEWELRGRELFIHFPGGVGQSKLKIPFQKEGTGRNLNTVRKLAEMVAAAAA